MKLFITKFFTLIPALVLASSLPAALAFPTYSKPRNALSPRNATAISQLASNSQFIACAPGWTGLDQRGFEDVEYGSKVIACCRWNGDSDNPVVDQLLPDLYVDYSLACVSTKKEDAGTEREWYLPDKAKICINSIPCLNHPLACCTPGVPRPDEHSGQICGLGPGSTLGWPC